MARTRFQLAAVCALLGVLALVAGAGIATRGPDSAGAFALGSAAIQVFLVLLAVALAALGSAPIAHRLGLRPARLSSVQTLGAALGFVALSMAIHAALELSALKGESALAEIEGRVAGQRGANLSWLLLALGLAPAVGEELLFRGAVLRSLLPRLRAGSAIGISALLFALVHLEPIHVAAAVPLGLYLGCLGWLAQSVWPPLIAHALNNTTAVLAPAFAVAETASPAGFRVEWAILAVGSLLAAAALAWVWRRAGPPPDPAGNAPDAAESAPDAAKNAPEVAAPAAEAAPPAGPGESGPLG